MKISDTIKINKINKKFDENNHPYLGCFSLFRNKALYGFHSISDISGKKIKLIDAKKILDWLVIYSTKKVLFRKINPLYKKDSIVQFKYVYEEYSPSEAISLLNDIEILIDEPTEKKDDNIKYIKLSKIIPKSPKYCTSYQSLIFNPAIQSGKYGKFFNTFQEIPVIPVSISNDDSEMLLVNNYIENLCGKESNPNVYHEYYNYLLNWLSWVFVNKKCSGIMIYFVGDGGSGKSIMANFISLLFSREYSTVLSSDSFNNCKFNSQIDGKLIVTIEEFKIENIKLFREKVNRTSVKEITRKGKDNETKETYENYIASSYELDKNIDFQDRRCCVIQCGYKMDDQYAKRVFNVLQKESTINKFRSILIKRYENIRNTFNIAKFPVSKLKILMSEYSLTDFQQFLIKEYYLYSDSRYNNDILFSDFYYAYIMHIKNTYYEDNEESTSKKEITSHAFAKLYKSSGIDKKRKRISYGIHDYVVVFPNRLYDTIFDKDNLIRLCIDYNTVNGVPTKKELFDEFCKNNHNHDNANAEKSKEFNEADLSSKLLANIQYEKRTDSTIFELALGANKNKLSSQEPETPKKLLMECQN